MKHIKLYEQFNELYPYGEGITYNDFLNEGIVDKLKSKINPKIINKVIEILEIEESDSKRKIIIKILKFMIKNEIADWRLFFKQASYSGVAFLFVTICDIMNIPPYVHDPQGLLNKMLDNPGMMNLPGIITIVAAFIYATIKGYKKYIKPLYKIK